LRVDLMARVAPCFARRETRLTCRDMVNGQGAVAAARAARRAALKPYRKFSQTGRAERSPAP